MNRRRFLNLLAGFLAALPFVRRGEAEPVEPWGPGPIQRAWDEYRSYQGTVVDWKKITVLPRTGTVEVEQITDTVYRITRYGDFEKNPQTGQWEQAPKRILADVASTGHQES